MKFTTTRALCALLLVAVAAPALADGSVNAVLGARPLKNDAYWSGHETPGGLGVMADTAMGPTLPLFLSAYGQWIVDGDSTDASSNYEELNIAELALGLKLMPQSGAARPYVGAGIQRDWVSYDLGTNTTDSDFSKGWYAEGGAMFLIGRHFNLGVNLRWIKDTHVTLYGADGDIDGRAYSLVAGYAWGDSAPRHHEGRERLR